MNDQRIEEGKSIIEFKLGDRRQVKKGLFILPKYTAEFILMEIENGV